VLAKIYRSRNYKVRVVRIDSLQRISCAVYKIRPELDGKIIALQSCLIIIGYGQIIPTTVKIPAAAIVDTKRIECFYTGVSTNCQGKSITTVIRECERLAGQKCSVSNAGQWDRWGRKVLSINRSSDKANIAYIAHERITAAKTIYRRNRTDERLTSGAVGLGKVCAAGGCLYTVYIKFKTGGISSSNNMALGV
jgi:hypothetical protein